MTEQPNRGKRSIAIDLANAAGRFDETAMTVERTPRHGEHTEFVLLDPGLDWDEATSLRQSGAIL